MHRLVVYLVVLLCATQATLGQQFDCSTEAGQILFLQNGARSDPDCYNPILNLVNSRQILSAGEIEDVCQDDCAGDIIDFLRSTAKCRNDKEMQDNVVFFQNELCAYKDGEGKPATSCALQNYSKIVAPLTYCFGWWLYGGTDCPAFLSATTTCTEALKTAVEDYGCCYQNLFGREEFIDAITRDALANLQGIVSSDFEVDVTDPKLFAACGVTLPEMCESLLASAPNLAATPLVALLFALIAKLFA